MPEDQLSWKSETWSMTADVEVLRFFTASGMPLPSRQIEVHFLSYGPSVKVFINGYPPVLRKNQCDPHAATFSSQYSWWSPLRTASLRTAWPAGKQCR